MSEAKRRGTFEERKAQAIAAGRVKKPVSKEPTPYINPLDYLSVILTLSNIKHSGKGVGKKKFKT